MEPQQTTQEVPISQRLEQIGRSLAKFPDRHPVYFCLLFALACVVVHTVLLLGYFEGIDYEEPRIGDLPKDLIQGRLSSVRSYQMVQREGAFYPFAYWTVPFFALLGPSLFAAKYAGVFLVAIGVWPWVDLARRIGGAAAAVGVGLLLLLPFPFYVRMTMCALAVSSHPGLVVFSGLCSWLIYRGFYERSLPAHWTALAVGFLFGLASFWTFSFWPIGVGLSITALLWGARLKHALLVAGGAIPGAVTIWFASISQAAAELGMSVVEVIKTKGAHALLGANPPHVTSVDLSTALLQLVRIFTSHMPRLAGFVPEDKPTNVIALHPSWIFYAALLAAVALIVASRWRARQEGEKPRPLAPLLPLLATIPVYLLAYLTSGVYTEVQGAWDRYRYLLPLAPFFFLIIGLGISQIPRLIPRRFSPGVTAGALVGLLILGLASASNVFAFSHFPTPYLQIWGYNRVFYVHFPDHYEKGLRMAGRTDYRMLAFILGADHAMKRERYRRTDSVAVPGLDRLLWPDFWEGVGAGYRYRVIAKGHSLDYLKYMASHGPPARRRAFVRGFAGGTIGISDMETPVMLLGRKQACSLDAPKVLAKAFADDPATRDKALDAAYEGLGLRARERPGACREEVKGLARFAEAFERGMAIAFARMMMPHTPWPHDVPMGRTSDTRMPMQFYEWVDHERRRLLRIDEAFEEKAPYTHPPAGAEPVP